MAKLPMTIGQVVESQSCPPLVLVCYMGSEMLQSCALLPGHGALLLVPYLEQCRCFPNRVRLLAEYNKCPAARLKQPKSLVLGWCSCVPLIDS